MILVQSTRIYIKQHLVVTFDNDNADKSYWLAH